MAYFKPGEEQLERRASVGRWQIVRASFGTANEDLIIRHQLQTTNPEEVAYQALNMTGPATLYHDGSATRLAWGDGFVRLRVSVAPVVMDILLQVVAAPIGTTKLPMGGATIPGINADTLDGLDSTAFARDAFKTIVIDGAGDVIADQPDDTLTLTAGAGIAFNSIPGADEIEIEALAPVIDELDDIGDVDASAPADGDVLTWDSVAGEWVATAPTGGGGGGGGWVMLEEHIASASATLDFTTWYSATYDDYIIELINVKPGTTGQDFRMQVSTNAGSSWQATNYYYSWIHCSNTGGSGVVSTGGGSLGYVTIFTQIDNTGGSGVSGSVKVFVPGSTTAQKHGLIDVYAPQVSAVYRGEGFWLWNTTTAINGIRFLFASGTVASGTIRVYGIVKTAGGGGGGAEALDDLTDVNTPAPADGDVLTWDSTPGEWVALPAGTSITELDDIPDVDAPSPADGDVLTWDSATSEWVASAPTGGGGALVFLEEHIASSSATLDFTTFLSSTYDTYEIVCTSIIPATNSTQLQMRMGTGAGPTWDTTSGNYSWVDNRIGPGGGASGGSASAQTAFMLTGSGNVETIQNSVSAGGWNSTFRLYNPQSTTGQKYYHGMTTWQSVNPTNSLVMSPIAGRYISTTAVTGLRFFMNSGNIASGTIRIYGIAKTASGGGGGGGASELDDLTDVNTPTPADGDVLTWDSTPGEWVALPPGTSITELDDIPDVDAPSPADGDVLTWDSATSEWVAAAPTGGGGSSGPWAFIDEITASGASSVDFTSCITSDYSTYMVTVEDMTHSAVARPFFRCSTNNGSSYDTGNNYDYNFQYAYTGGAPSSTGANSTAAMYWRDTNTTVATNGAWNGTFTFYNPLGSKYKEVIGLMSWFDNSVSAVVHCRFGGQYRSTTAVDAIQVAMSSGTISGTFRIYGLANTGGTGGSGSPGAIVQVQNYQTGTMATGSTTIPHDNTIPQNTEGDQYMSLAITPTSATNKLKIDIVFIGTANGANWIICSLFQDSNANALATSMNYENIGSSARNNIFSHWMTAGTTSSTTFKVRAGVDSTSPGTVTFNGAAGAAKFGGTMASSITITEIDPAGTGASGILSDSVGQLDIANTTTETTLYTYSIPAGTLSTAKGLKLDLIGDWLNNTGSDQAIRLRIKYGATTLHDETAGTMPSAATRRPWTLNIQLGNTGTTNSQFATVSWLLGNAQAGTAGLGDAAVAMHLNHLGSGTSAEDSTLVKALTVTIELSAASANLSFRRQNASLKEL